MTTSFSMPERKPSDGAVGVNRAPGNDALTLTATTDGIEQSMTVSPHNAARLFALLSLMLGIPLPAKLGKEIRL